MNNANSSFFPSWKNNRSGWICFAMLAVLAVVASLVHEPWYDEVQAWQIAKTATWYDIFFQVPHFEGHPPFWHILLAIPAKAGVAWQWVLRPLGIMVMLISAFLIIFKSPFPRWIRLTLPFTYFLFFQYGILARPYGLMVLIMILLAMAFPTKDSRPLRFITLLAALCGCHLFGIAIAGGITMAWLWEIKGKQSWAVFIHALLKDRRFHYMLGLLAWAVLLLVCIWPQQYTAADSPYKSSVFLNIIYLLFGMIADSVLTNYHNMFFIKEIIHKITFLIPIAMIGMLLWYLLLKFLPRKNWKYLLLPYMLLACLMIIYCFRHHVGLFFVLILWVMWISLQAPDFKWPHWSEFPAKLGKAILVLSIIVPISWTATHIYFDSRFDIFNGKQAVQFLADHDLLNKRIFGVWKIRRKNNQIVRQQIYSQEWVVQLSLYTPHNIVANFHDGGPQLYSSTQQAEGDNHAESTFARWREGGLPDVLLGPVPLETIWDIPHLEAQYVPVYEIYTYDLWKFNVPRQNFLTVSVRKDLLEKHHLHRIETHDWDEAEEED